jgi:hypothetical protein
MALLKFYKKIRDNTYKIELLDDYGVSTTFNVFNLSFYIDDELLDSKRVFSNHER